VSAARWRRPAIAAIVVAALVVVAALLGAATPGPRGPESSSYATQPRGTAAWASLLARSGHPVTRLRRRLDDRPLPRGATLVLLDPNGIADGEIAALNRFLLDGGSAVLGGAADQDCLREALLGVPPLRGLAGDTDAEALVPVAQTAGVRTLRSAGDGVFANGGRLLPIAGGRRGALALAGGSGGGRVTVLADASPLQNRLLDRADNAAFALAVAGGAGRPVVFSELQHGYGRTGLAALPAQWKVALALAVQDVALRLAEALRPKVAGPFRDLPPERFLEALDAARRG
jgi:hypothetical protein